MCSFAVDIKERQTQKVHWHCLASYFLMYKNCWKIITFWFCKLASKLLWELVDENLTNEMWQWWWLCKLWKWKCHDKVACLIFKLWFMLLSCKKDCLCVTWWIKWLVLWMFEHFLTCFSAFVIFWGILWLVLSILEFLEGINRVTPLLRGPISSLTMF